MGDFEEFIEEFMGEADDGVPVPSWRATIRRGRLMLTSWAPFLITGGPLGTLFPARRRAGVAIADLTNVGEGELAVRYWSPGPDRAEADGVLIGWARDVGYRRLWMDDRVIELEPDPERLQEASVSCPTCRAGWSDATPEFWLTVRNAKTFPKWCPLCGCELPSWTVKAAAGERKSPASESEPSASWAMRAQIEPGAPGSDIPF